MSPAAVPPPVTDNAVALWAFLGTLATALLAYLGRNLLTKRQGGTVNIKEQVTSALAPILAELSSLKAEMADLKKASASEELQRTAFMATIEASMVTKDDLRTATDHLAERQDASARELHGRMNEHVRDYHRPAAA